jgi:hypothetical protein
MEDWAFVATAVGLLGLVATLFLNLYPRVMVSSISPKFNLTIGNAASAPYTLKVMTIVALIFTPIVLVYQGWSYWIFRDRVKRPPVSKESEAARPDGSADLVSSAKVGIPPKGGVEAEASSGKAAPPSNGSLP